MRFLRWNTPRPLDRIQKARLINPKKFKAKNIGLRYGSVNIDHTRHMIRFCMSQRKNNGIWINRYPI
jgi:hypothetical protein